MEFSQFPMTHIDLHTNAPRPLMLCPYARRKLRNTRRNRIIIYERCSPLETERMIRNPSAFVRSVLGEGWEGGRAGSRFPPSVAEVLELLFRKWSLCGQPLF